MPASRPETSPRPLPWLNRLPHPYVLAAVMLIVSLLVAPTVCYLNDFRFYWWYWMRESGGLHPWRSYSIDPLHHADMPPVAPFLLTGAERVRLWFHASDTAPITYLAIKLPSILCYLGGVPLCLHGLRRPFGAPAARAAAVCYALCLPLFFDAAYWGQWDAILALAMAGGIVAVLNDRPLLAGALLAVGLGVKAQAIVIVPALMVYLWRRTTPRGVLLACGVGLATLAAILLPAILSGGGGPIYSHYFTAATRFPRRSISSYNFWYLMDGYDTFVRHLPVAIARDDRRPILGPITSKEIGLTALAAYVVFVLAALWRRPTPRRLVLAAVMTFFGFFMLPTEMHDRYLVPGVALLALIAWDSRWLMTLYVGLNVTVSLNVVITVLRANWRYPNWHFPGMLIGPHDRLSLVVAALDAAAQILLFVWATAQFSRTMRSGDGDPPPTETKAGGAEGKLFPAPEGLSHS